MSKVNNKTKRELLEELEALRQRVAELEESEDKCERAGGGLRNDCQTLLDAQHDLRERVKELNCLYRVTQLMTKPGTGLEDVFKGVVDLVTNAWQYPEITCARIIFDGKEFITNNFKSTEWKQSSDIKLNGEIISSLEVYYLEGKPELNEGPFLKEKRSLIDSVAVELGNCVERKQAEEKLREGRAFAENLISSMKDGFSILDNHSVHLNVNSALCQMTGFTREELIGVGPPHPYWPEEQYEEIQKAFQKTLRGEFEDFELTFKRRNGERFPVIVSPSWLRDEDGNIISYFATVKDITERKRVEQKLKDYKNYLEELVEKRTAKLIKADKQLRVQMEQRTEFTKTLVHELKTPLTPLLGASDILVDKLRDEGLRRIARNINRGAHNLNNRINDLMELAKGEVELLEIHCRPIDLLQMLRDLADYMTPEADRKKQILTLDLPTSLPTAYADEDRLRQVILNLLNNALKFTPTGGKINIKAETGDAGLIVHVTDTGYGIAKKDHKWLFELYRTIKGHKEQLSGLGIGLLLSKMLVELHGGQIWVESRKGKGSTFSFSIPMKANQ